MPDTEEETENLKKPFENLDLKGIQIFGGRWVELATQSKTLGWSGVDKLALEKNLARAVDTSYFRIVSFNVEDLDDEITWHASFLNDKGLWELEIFDSPHADVEPEQMADFFGSAEFKRIAKKAGWILEESRKAVNEVITPKLEAGELLSIDEVKLAAIMHWISDKQFMENLRSGKFMEA